MKLFIEFVLFVLGLCIGSFINMGIYRVAVLYGLKKKKFKVNKRKRSFCDYCGVDLPWWNNIPVISWFLLRGKSSCCNRKLPFVYPLVELLTGGMFLMVSMKYFELNLNSVLTVGFGFLVISFLIFSTFFDIKYMILPDFSTFILIGLAFVGVVFDEKNIIPYLLSALGGFLFLGFLNLITRGKGMGLGDVKLAIFMGLFLGWPKILVAYYLAFIVGAVYGVVMLLMKKVRKRGEIAFGPFLIMGAVIAWMYGKDLLAIVNSYILR